MFSKPFIHIEYYIVYTKQGLFFQARFGIGEQCQEYSVAVKAETGVYDGHPSARLKFGWNREPRIAAIVIPYVKRYCVEKKIRAANVL